MAQVHHEEVAIHVEALPAREVVLLVEVELAHQHRVAHRPDAPTGEAGPDGVLGVVVEDEELRVGEADLPDHAAPDHEALEGDVLHLDQGWHGGAIGIRRVDRRPLGAHHERVAQVEVDGRLLDQGAGEVLANGDEAVLVDRHQGGEAVGRRHDVVVHQPDAVEAAVVGRPHAEVEAAGPAEVGLGGRDVQWQVVARVEDGAGVVSADVVDDDDRVRSVRLGREPVEHPDQQVGAVVGDDDDRDLLAHARNLWCPS